MFRKIFGEKKEKAYSFKEYLIEWATIKKQQKSKIVLIRSVPNESRNNNGNHTSSKRSYYFLTTDSTEDILALQHFCPKTRTDHIQLTNLKSLNKKQLSLLIDPNNKEFLKDSDQLNEIENNQKNIDTLNSIYWTQKINLNSNDNKHTNYNEIAIGTMTTIRDDIKKKKFEMVGNGKHYINLAKNHDQYVPKGVKYTLEKFDELADKASDINSDDIDETYKKLHRHLAKPTSK